MLNNFQRNSEIRTWDDEKQKFINIKNDHPISSKIKPIKQYSIGKRDSNKKMIFEGDICKVGEKKVYVYYNLDKCQFLFSDDTEIGFCEIIGTVLENNDLI